jgi:putative NIF3 family GTP cyclohydrolase 1 type 2
MLLVDFCYAIKQILDIESINVTGDLKRNIRKVGICSGKGTDFIEKAYINGCDAYITGDIGYHHACDARDMGIALIDAGHYATENIYMMQLANYLKSAFTPEESNVNIILSKTNNNPYLIV